MLSGLSRSSIFLSNFCLWNNDGDEVEQIIQHTENGVQSTSNDALMLQEAFGIWNYE